MLTESSYEARIGGWSAGAWRVEFEDCISFDTVKVVLRTDQWG